MVIEDELKELANIWKGDLYIVGGAVRDFILDSINQMQSFISDDMDLTSTMSPEEVIQLLDENGISYYIPDAYEGSDERITTHGTVVITINGKKYEHTSFREDVINTDNPSHKCKLTTHCRDLIKDSKRRDFSINAIYYNILTEEIVDPQKGIQDIKDGVIRVIGNANRFNEDPLRLMRFVRFVTKLGFRPDEKTLMMVKNHAFLIRNVSKERIREEIEKGYQNNDYFYYLEQWGLLKMILGNSYRNWYINNYNLVTMWASLTSASVAKERFSLSNATYRKVNALENLYLELAFSNYGRNVDLLKLHKLRMKLDCDDETIYSFLLCNGMWNNKVRSIMEKIKKEVTIRGNDLINLGFKEGKELGEYLAQANIMELEGKEKKEIIKTMEYLKNGATNS